MTTLTKELIERTLASNGAIQVESAEERGVEPLFITVGGPIKWWWQPGNWGTDLHNHYVAVRTAVRTALIEAGYCTYFPNDAIKGSWSEKAQRVNDAAILSSDLFIALALPGVVADGTEAELALARENGVVIHTLDVSMEGLDARIHELLAHCEGLQAQAG